MDHTKIGEAILAGKGPANAEPLLYVSLKLDNIVWGAADDSAHLLQGKYSDILALLQGIKGLVVNAALQELVLRHFLFFYRKTYYDSYIKGEESSALHDIREAMIILVDFDQPQIEQHGNISGSAS